MCSYTNETVRGREEAAEGVTETDGKCFIVTEFASWASHALSSEAGLREKWKSRSGVRFQMASACNSSVEEQPPALPVKQLRSRHSSVESDFRPVGPHHHTSAYNDVFPEPTDCNAAQCPIHQRYDPSRHLERFFSDGTPPPVPKKKLARTLSFPATRAPSFTPVPPLSPVQRCPRNFDNPLYMMSCIPAHFFQEEEEEFKAATKSPVTAVSFSQLSFDTPDEHLPQLFSSFDDQRAISQGIQHRHLLFLRSMAQAVEAGCLLEVSERDLSSYQPRDFLLCEGSKPKQIGNMTYYSLHSPKLPGRVFGLRVHKQTDEAFSARIQPSHVNVQDVLTYFQPNNVYKNTERAQDPAAGSFPPTPDCSPAKPPGGGSTERAVEYVNLSELTVQSFLQKWCTVHIERDLPRATLEDFFKDSCLLQSTESVHYYRQVCALLLQILMGLHHLYSNSGSAAQLKPQEILLVWPDEKKDKGENELNEDASDVKDGFETSKQKVETECENTQEKGRIQMFWKTRGCPRVVLMPQTSSQPLISIKLQIRDLIQLCLHPQESPTSLGSAPDLCKSFYQNGLLYLASLLQRDSGPQMANMVAILQVLLWGPRISLFAEGGPSINMIHNWLTIKRALLVMKLAERGLIQDQSLLDWEDSMCLHYLAFTDSETIMSVANQLWHTVNPKQCL